ncbi:Nuclear transport receptor Karyopherin-beta2/Transportin [Trichophyton interdigitale]|nr:Nuclear transport receptor Karyopherin-beta2/Transportin [Trichophyton interdigitale]KAG5216977.1 Nuclear transport receptor Karyopherin-beta2/Transportin [Trichophyton interdigitale]KAG8205484.1 Nuclear transport receptor Karyopherin-beta2/Transportin [Trichophyton interdigitale]
MAWQAEESTLAQLAGYLNDTLNARDQAVRKNAEQMLTQATSSPDFVNYLSFLLRTPQPPAAVGFDIKGYNVVRIAAAMNLKTKIKVAYQSIPPEALAYLQTASLVALGDESTHVANSAGTIMAEMIKQGGILGWPTLLEELVSLVGNASASVPSRTQEAAMTALQRICEDNHRLLQKEIQGQQPIHAILPKIMEFTASSVPKVRTMALSTVHMFIAHKSPALMQSLDTFLQCLFKVAEDPNTDVRRAVCQAFNQLAEVAPEKLIPYIDGLVNYVLMQEHSQEDPELVLDASEFWIVAGEEKQLRSALTPYLPKIIPVLLQNMVYDEEEAALIAGKADDADEQDRPEDLKPQFAKTKSDRLASAKEGEDTSNGEKKPAPESEDSDDDDLSDGEIEDDPEEEWTIRKSSATALDIFATVYHQPVFEIVLPYLREHLKNPSWAHREASVLALGAIADGCMLTVQPHLPELIPYLVSLLTDPEPIVRMITCWCLGRYSGWAAHLEPAEKARFFEPMMEGMLHRMLDNNKKVQEAAASGFRSLEEKSGPHIIPYCEPILRQFVLCFDKYKDRNLDVLYDCVQTLAECTMSELAKPALVSILMPCLIGRWNKAADESREIFPLLECLGYIASAYGHAFTPFAPPIFSRCTKLIYNTIMECNALANGQTTEEPNKDYFITCLDLLSAIIQAIDRQKSEELVASTQPSFFQLLAYCLQDPYYDVGMSAYAVLGDCAMVLFEQLQPFLPTIMPTLLKQLDLDQLADEDSSTGLSVVNNACWACGEISINAKSDMAPYAENLYTLLYAIMINEEIRDSVTENAAIALGRLGIGCAEQLAPRLAQYAYTFLLIMSNVEFSREKVGAFAGFNQVLKQNPQALESCLPDYFSAVASMTDKPFHAPEFDDLDQSTRQVLQGYKELIPDFAAFMGTLDPNVAWRLQTAYQI